MSRIFSIIVLALTLSFTVGEAQNGGYAGRRLLLKLDAVNGTQSFLSGAHLEAVLLRKLTLSAGYIFSPYKVDQVYDPSLFPASSSGLTEPDEKATITPRLFTFELRKYQRNAMLGAPRGAFMYLNITSGSLNVDGSFYQGIFLKEGAGIDRNKQLNYSYTGARQFSWEFGWGYQGFVTPRVTLGVQMGFTFTTMKVNNSATWETLLSGVSPRVGYNWIALSGDDAVGIEANSGISFRIQIGYMIL